ncbi:MAG: XTP/dITP diphosphatase [Clostridia bacterium]|nr:XTP/dITP diphosphatase [Clostridia bacterium]
MKFVIATNNSGKVKDFNLILSLMGHEAVSLKDMNIEIDVEETGTTFKENSYIKAKAIYDYVKMPTIADDSGLCVDALDGAPGVYSARYGGEGLDDHGRCLKLLEEMKDKENRKARFKSAICCILDDFTVIETEGECEGTLLCEIVGENGFGYDPMFYVEKYKKTFGEVSKEEKNEISHRRKAMNKLKEELEKIL